MKKGTIIVGVVLVLIVAASISRCANGKGKTNSSTSNSSNSSSVSSEKQNTVSSSSDAFDFSEVDLTTDNIKNAITDGTIKDDLDDIKINGNQVSVYVYEKSFWSVKSLLKGIQGDSASLFHDLFVNKKIDEVTYWVDVPVQDKYGNESKEWAFDCSMKRSDAEKVNDWTAFATESATQYYSVVSYELGKVKDVRETWAEIYK